MGNIISVHANAETAAANNACLPDANEDRSVVNMSTSSKKRCIILKTSVHPGQQVCIVLTAKHIDTTSNTNTANADTSYRNAFIMQAHKPS